MRKKTLVSGWKKMDTVRMKTLIGRSKARNGMRSEGAQEPGKGGVSSAVVTL